MSDYSLLMYPTFLHAPLYVSFTASRTVEDYMTDKVNFVLTNSKWDDTFDEVNSEAGQDLML